MSRVPAKKLHPAGLPASFQPNSSMESEQFLDGDASHRSRKQKRAPACKECRQAKLKCDRENIPGQPSCSRCRRLSLECRVDSDYKRVNKRTKLDELAEQVELLSSVVSKNGHTQGYEALAHDSNRRVNANTNTHSPPKASHSPPQSISNYPVGRNSQPSSISRHDGVSPAKNRTLSFTGRKNTQPRNLNIECAYARSLEDIELGTVAINRLFYEFFENYHPFLELLDPEVSPDEYYARSPLLFWCIICVAARQSGEDTYLSATLNPSVTRLMWTTLSVLPHSRFTVQALILVSMWPFPTNTMSKDLSFTFVSLAKVTCMQLGLHRPETVQDFLRVRTTFGPREFQEAVKIWAGCFISAQSVAASSGQPLTFSGDWAIDQACDVGNKYSLPDNIRTQLLIYKFIARVNKIMTESERSATGYPPEAESYVLMAMLETDFYALERQIIHDATSVQSILLSIACVQLRTYYFFMTPGTDIRKQGLLKAYAAAVTLISKAADADEKWNFTLFASSGFTQVIVIAAMVLMKIVNSSFSGYVDNEDGKHAFNTAISLVRKSSVEDNDLPGRVSKITAQLWNLHRSLNQRKEEEPSVNIKTRWGASLLHDSLWTWREEFGGQKAPSQMSNAATLSSSGNQVPIPDGTVPGPSFSTPRTDESWISGTRLSQNQGVGPQHTAAEASEMPGLESLMDLPETDWIWDIGFPSVMPIDIDSYQALETNENLDFKF